MSAGITGDLKQPIEFSGRGGEGKWTEVAEIALGGLKAILDAGEYPTNVMIALIRGIAMSDVKVDDDVKTRFTELCTEIQDVMPEGVTNEWHWTAKAMSNLTVPSSLKNSDGSKGLSLKKTWMVKI